MRNKTKEVIERIEFYVNAYGYEAEALVLGEVEGLTIEAIAAEIGVGLDGRERDEVVAHYA